jgi:hypothetical protein
MQGWRRAPIGHLDSPGPEMVDPCLEPLRPKTFELKLEA